MAHLGSSEEGETGVNSQVNGIHDSESPVMPGQSISSSMPCDQMELTNQKQEMVGMDDSNNVKVNMSDSQGHLAVSDQDQPTKKKRKTVSDEKETPFWEVVENSTLGCSDCSVIGWNTDVSPSQDSARSENNSPNLLSSPTSQSSLPPPDVAKMFISIDKNGEVQDIQKPESVSPKEACLSSDVDEITSDIISAGKVIHNTILHVKLPRPESERTPSKSKYVQTQNLAEELATANGGGDDTEDRSHLHLDVTRSGMAFSDMMGAEMMQQGNLSPLSSLHGLQLSAGQHEVICALLKQAGAWTVSKPLS